MAWRVHKTSRKTPNRFKTSGGGALHLQSLTLSRSASRNNEKKLGSVSKNIQREQSRIRAENVHHSPQKIYVAQSTLFSIRDESNDFPLTAMRKGTETAIFDFLQIGKVLEMHYIQKCKEVFIFRKKGEKNLTLHLLGNTTLFSSRKILVWKVQQDFVYIQK